ncbi:MAG: hypothetical protein IIU44_01450, partial [Spirochaetales bacterium]|nr:hypothetical protein [Spirochaetales bacterium]
GSEKVAEEKPKKEGEEPKASVLKNIKAILKDGYGIEEEDFISAEIEVVPAGRARDCGIDASMVMAYGQDDKVCAFTSLKAMLEMPADKKTTCCLLTDKLDGFKNTRCCYCVLFHDASSLKLLSII